MSKFFNLVVACVDDIGLCTTDFQSVTLDRLDIRPKVKGCFLFLAIAIFSLSSIAHAANEAVIPESQRALFKSYCVKCHNSEMQEGKVRLDDIPLHIADAPTAERWQKVLEVLNSGEMPPEDEKQPKPDEKAAFLEVLSKQIVIARKALSDSGGLITMRRLNRREYVNTIRDLLDVEIKPKDLPADDDGGSFDTIGSGLFFSSDQFQQYLKLARIALDEAIVSGPQPKVQKQRREPETEANRHVQGQHDKLADSKARFDAWKASAKEPTDFGFQDEAEAKISMQRVNNNLRGYQAYLAEPATQRGLVLQPFTGVFGQDQTRLTGNAGPGMYRFRIRAAAMEPKMRQFIEIGLHGNGEGAGEMDILHCLEVTASMESPQIIELNVAITKSGSHIIAVRERRPNSSEAADYVGGQRIKENDGNGYRGTVWIDWIEWEGPIIGQWPPRSHERVFGKEPLPAKPDDAFARRTIERFAGRAFRGRTMKPEFLERLMMHFHERIAAGEKFIEAIKTPLSIVLASPSFLYIAEHSGDRAGKAKLSDIELANRLAYFLWSSPPDDALMQLARDGKLSDGAVLTREVDRMLADEKVIRFISGFTHQWLHMVRLDFFQFNHRLYPKFDGSVKESARREVYETLRTVMKDDLPLGSLLKSDFVVVNDILADYYEIEGVTGTEFRRVPVPVGRPRGGLPGMAAILAMGSDGERTSPVERGVWVLSKLLHDAPPPAPANVPQLSRFSGKLMPARELLLAHQEQPQCSQCHRRIDPIGFGLEHFNAVGQWREQEYTEIAVLNKVVKQSQLFPIDATGTLPDGTKFDGFQQLRDAIAKHEADFAKGLIEHLIEFALGRPCGFSDDDLVQSILQNAKPQRYTPRALIHALVSSTEFHSK
jgi:hypothetical protein